VLNSTTTEFNEVSGWVEKANVWSAITKSSIIPFVPVE
jgi:hypothetical protein